MKRALDESLLGFIAVFIAAVLWGTTGTAATFAPEVSAVAIGAVAMGFGGLLQALLAGRQIRQNAAHLKAQWKYLITGR
ncbi:hypothetical protein [Salinimonas marina]|uniref:hypothetical protein n=1 Tax=Salinimonas marina TaxID=2785918 RepID=UPI001E570A7C|nr:hypothetical protein [Salinimonas marina]